MLPGDLIARRFLVEREVSSDDAPAIEGLTVWLARDVRLEREVWVHHIDSAAPSAVLRAAAHSRLVSDARLVKVLAHGVERSAEQRTSYVVTKAPQGRPLSTLLRGGALPRDVAVCLVQQVNAALTKALSSGEHHGAVDSSTVWLNSRGTVEVWGLGFVGELVSQAGLSKGRTERADAQALARLTVHLLTGLDAAEASISDLDAELGDSLTSMCKAVLRSAGPKSLAEHAKALGNTQRGALAAFASANPSLWWDAAVPAIAGTDESAVEIDGVGELSPAEDEVLEDPIVEAASVEEALVDEPTVVEDIVVEDIVEEDFAAGPYDDVAQPEAVVQERPRTRFGGAVDDIDEFHDIVAAQNATPRVTALEAALDALQRRFPASAPIARAAEAAHRRAAQPVPFNVVPLVVMGLLAVVVYAGYVAFERVQAEPEPTQKPGVTQEYPEYTFGPSATASPAEEG